MTDPRIAVLSALSSPGWHPVPEAHGMPWDEAEQLLAAYDASRAAAAPSAPADRAALRDLAANALADAEGWQWAPGYDKAQSPTYQHYLRQADAVLAVLPEPADRAAILREAADAAAEKHRRNPWTTAADVIADVRRMAGEAQQPETQAAADCPYGEGPGNGSGCVKPAGHDGDHVVTPGVTVVPCSRAVLQQPHIPHSWWPQPGMPYVQCPGHSVDPAAASRTVVAQQADTAGEQQ
jgi:hypothetical protein